MGFLLWKIATESESFVPAWTQSRPGVKEEITMTENPVCLCFASPKTESSRTICSLFFFFFFLMRRASLLFHYAASFEAENMLTVFMWPVKKKKTAATQQL